MGWGEPWLQATEVSVKMLVTVWKNIFKKYAKTETVWENHVCNDTPKNASSSVPLEIVNLLNFVHIIMKEKNITMIELNGMIKQLETLKAEITKLKVQNVPKEIKL